jgi:hypothetical protein
MPTEMMTICFHTRDAIERKDASFTFRLPGGRLRNDAMKVALASCEFPMVQWTVEDAWNRMYVNEGIELHVETRTVELVADDASVACVVLPLRVNPVRHSTWSAHGLTVECVHPHGLAHGPHAAPLTRVLQRGVHAVRLVGGALGDVSLSEAVNQGRLVVVDERTLRVRAGGDAVVPVGNGAHALVCASLAGPHHLCEVLQDALGAALCDTDVALRVCYDATHDKVRVSATTGSHARLTLVTTPLLQMCGVSSMPVRVVNGRAAWPCESTRFWDHVYVPSGFYSPCHRSLCTGQPMRLSAELEAAANRLYFPVPAPGAPGHHMVFSDPTGRVVTCEVPAGRYTPVQFCHHVQTAMTEAVCDPAVSYTVYHDDRDRFVFVCERRDAGGCVRPATFSILFHHPLSIDAVRLGFFAQPLSGSDTYVAAHPYRAARGTGGRYATNVVRIHELAAQKRFSVHVTAPPAMIGVVATGSRPGLLRVRTHVNRVPFAHGLQAGDTVRLSACGNVTLRKGVDDEYAVESSRAQLAAQQCTCLVVQEASDDATLVTIVAPDVNGLADVDTAVQLVCDVEPWNVCFGVHARSLMPHLMGFAHGATLWGVDGCVQDAQNLWLPPYVAPHVHNLDHPDYVLMTLSETSGAALEHAYDRHNTHVFCKLSLYPLFREERMLPRDTTLLRNNLSTFTLAFWNPDMTTPYYFHGCDFSFSLNFLSAVPDA